MTDEKFEQFLRKAGQSYNAPPARVPRDEMWNEIRAARSAGPRLVHGGASHIESQNRFGVKVWWAAAAALVLLAGGVGLGRWSASSDKPAVAAGPPAPTTNVVRSDPIRDDTRRSPVNDATPAPPGALEATGPAAQRAPVATVDGQDAVSPIDRRQRSRFAASTPISDRAPTPGRAPATGIAPSRGSATSAYEVAEVDHLTQAEALLTSFRTRSATDQQQDARLAAWARELLSNTRLLLDSPVAEDPQRRPLLQDLELLLVQIVQLSPGSTPQDRELVEKTLRQDQLMTKLRTAIPAGQRGS